MMMDADGIGWCRAEGMGQGPVPWSEIVAFASHAGLDEWERGTIRALSLAYLEGLDIGVDPGARAPNQNLSAEDRKAQAMAIRNAMAGMRRKKKE